MRVSRLREPRPLVQRPTSPMAPSPALLPGNSSAEQKLCPIRLHGSRLMHQHQIGKGAKASWKGCPGARMRFTKTEALPVF